MKDEYFSNKKQDSTRRGADKPRFPSSEHKKGKTAVLICPKCHAVYFDKHWHDNEFLSQAYKWNRGVSYQLCPEDKLIMQGGGKVNYEGELVLSRIPQDLLMEIAREVRNIAKRAKKRDPEDKAMRIEIKKSSIRVLTTENQLAVSIGKQIDHAHKGGELEIKWSERDKLARVFWKHKK
ncbi:hypothetical protein L6259_03300 [Candidatus Parcubacteria bacterium]|nr:hypothetical protein [Patescibacteria group bacterium]MCG2694264.1 hypothetical protein [Candidatus Parcubacteria bacterium]